MLLSQKRPPICLGFRLSFEIVSDSTFKAFNKQAGEKLCRHFASGIEGSVCNTRLPVLQKERKQTQRSQEVKLSWVEYSCFDIDISISIRYRVCLLFIPLFRAEFCFSQMCFFDQNTLLAAKKIRSKQRNCNSWLLQNGNPTLFGYTYREHPPIRNYFFKVWQNGFSY